MSETMLPIADERESATALRRLTLQHGKRVARLLMFHCCAAVLAVLSPAILGSIIDEATMAQWESVPGLFVVMCCLIVGQTILTWAAHRSSNRLGEFVFHDLREGVIGGIVKLPFRTAQRASSGDVLSRTTNDIDAVADGVRVGLPEVLVGVVSVVCTAVAAFVVDWRIALSLVVGLPLLFASTRWYVRRSQQAYDAELASHAVFDTAVLATISGRRVVRAFGLGESRAAAAADGAKRVMAAENRTLRLQSVWFPLVQAAYYLPLVLVMIWGGWLVLTGSSSIGSVVTIALYVQIIIDPMDDLLYWADQLQLGRSAFARISGVSGFAGEDDRPSADQGRSVGDSESDGSPRVTLRNVRFEYEPGRRAIGPITLDLGTRSSIAVVGASGAGKSTLGLLLSGVCLPTSGVLTLGDRAVHGDELRRHVALVTQERHVFSGTIRDNLLLADPNADAEALCKALAAVGATEWGLDDEPDDDLPASAVQQLAIAQVILRRPQIVVLDEATSEIARPDALELELRVREALPEATIISIAHRLDAAANADRVLVIDDGLVVADGSHDDLLRSDGVYSTLWNAWNTRGVRG
jgi:ABC-type multidrug transport system fused ATPase/permease subunit